MAAVPRVLENLSDYEFETLVADLLGAELRMKFEQFARGADAGVDLRCIRKRGGPEVVQCKHYAGSSFGALRRAARREKKKLDVLRPKPSTYRFVASQSLTADRKKKLSDDLAPWIRREDHILGAEDIDALIRRHPRVERQHVKLWLSSGEQLTALLQAGSHNRSKALVRSIQRALPLYVQSAKFFEARQLLDEEGAVLISGPPGIGKTTLARLLLADGTAAGFQPFEVSEDIEEAWDLYSASERQIFYYDDFLGRAYLGEKLRKNEDRRLVEFMSLARQSKATRLVLTTREYILRQATNRYEPLRQYGLDDRRILLRLDDYTRLERAQIFYNHIYQSGQLPRTARRALLKGRSYLDVVDHPNYTPRLIEYITGLSTKELDPSELSDYVRFAVTSLDDPERLWAHAFDEELTDAERSLLLVLATLPTNALVDDLETAWRSYCSHVGIEMDRGGLRRALKVVEPTFVETHRRLGAVTAVFENPSILDFVLLHISKNSAELDALLESAVFFEQLQALTGVGTDHPAAGLRKKVRRRAEVVVRGLIRTFSVPSRELTWVMDGDEYEPEPTEADSSARLEVVLEARAWSDDARTTVDHWLPEGFELLAKQIPRGAADLDAAIRVITQAADIGLARIARKSASAMKREFADGAKTPRDYIRMRLLWEAHREWLTQKEARGLIDGFSEQAAYILEDPLGYLDDFAELDDFEEALELFGVPYNDDEVYEARDALQEQLNQAEPDDPYDYEEPEDRPLRADRSEIQEIETLFARLEE